LSEHANFLSRQHPNYLITSILIPLAPANLADALLTDEHIDLDTTPDYLLSLPDTHFFESDPHLRRILLETILLLTSTRHGRDILREEKAYYIVREMHKLEKDKSVILIAERIVNMLMRDESSSIAEGQENLNELMKFVGSGERDEELESVLQTGKEEDADSNDGMVIEEII